MLKVNPTLNSINNTQDTYNNFENNVEIYNYVTQILNSEKDRFRLWGSHLHGEATLYIIDMQNQNNIQ